MKQIDIGSYTKNAIYSGDAATDELFGTNFLFNRDGTATPGEIDPNYEQFIAETGASTIRFPGGTLSEERLDLANPDSLEANYSNPNYEVSDPTVPLSSFLAFCESAGASATLVLPTYRFLTSTEDASGHRTIDPSEEQNLRSYIKYALTKADGLGVEIAAFEIGNEWHVDNTEVFGFRMSPIEYGRIANYMSAIVQDEIDNFRKSTDTNGPEPSIAVQVGPGGDKEWYTPSGERVQEGEDGITATELILSQIINPSARAAIDAIITHRYLHGDDDSVSGWAYSPFETWAKLAKSVGGFKVAEKFVTEWNVSSRNTDQHGLSHFDSVVELVREMMLAGVDHANVWAVQQNNDTRLIENSGSDSRPYGGLTFGGIAFDICASQLPGLRVIKTPDEISGLAVNAFGSEKRTVSFLTNRSEVGQNATIDLAKIASGGHLATIYHISEDAAGKPIVSVKTVLLGSNSVERSFLLGPQDSVVIVVARPGSGLAIEGYDSSDDLLGSTWSDTLFGGGGNDSLSGRLGDDLVDGEAGNDHLFGGVGNDSLSGGSGSDYIVGGAGNDLFFLSSGSDTIIGGVGVDVLAFERCTSPLLVDLSVDPSLSGLLGDTTVIGIEGFMGGRFDDTLTGGEDHDRLFGSSGDDLLNGGSGHDTLGGGGENDSIIGGLGGDTLLGGSGDDFLQGEDDTDLIGGGLGNDSLFGGTGDDTIQGLLGKDQIFGGEGSDRLMGGLDADYIQGDDGNDTVLGGSGVDDVLGGNGDDFLHGGADADTVSGDLGDDIVSGDDGKDSLFGGDGADRISGGADRDLLFGGDGMDLLDGGAGDDYLAGGSDADSLYGSWGVDNIYGEDGNDLVYGGGDNDLVNGGFGDDTVFGGIGNDHVIGGGGNDALFGGAGGDALVGGAGSDSMEGGLGEDSFIFRDAFDSSVILDFEDDVDTLVFKSGFHDGIISVEDFVATFVQIVDGTAFFDFGESGQLTVQGVSSIDCLYDDILLIA